MTSDRRQILHDEKVEDAMDCCEANLIEILRCLVTIMQLKENGGWLR